MEVLNLEGFTKYPHKQCKDSTGGATQNITTLLQIPPSNKILRRKISDNLAVFFCRTAAAQSI